MNIPNILTLSRILLTPLFVIFVLKEGYSSALMIFSAAAVSDALDGFIARYFNQRTLLGAYLDPVADKILLMAAFVCLANLRIIPSWLSVIVVSRDILIVVGISVLKLLEIEVHIRPTRVSKCTTALQLITIAWVLADPHMSVVLVTGSDMMKKLLFWLTSGLTIASGLHYIYLGMNMLQDALE